MSIKKGIGFNIVGLFLLILTSAMVSCGSDDEPTIAELTFIDLENLPVANVEIILECTTSIQRPCNFLLVGVTDENGKFTHEFSEPKILNVKAQSVADVKVNVDSNLMPIYEQRTLYVDGTVNIKKFQTNIKIFQMDTLK